MSAKYTPGPWKVEYGQDSGRPLGIFAPGDAGIPGAVGCVVRRNGIGMPSSPVAEANARLIAKAPDLYAALSWAEALNPETAHAAKIRALLAEIDGAK